MKFPLVLYLAMWSQALPLAAAALTRRRLGGARAWLLAWCALGLAADLLSIWMSAIFHRENIWVRYLLSPVQAAITLWALSCLQVGARTRITLRFGVAAMLIAGFTLTATLEDTASFSRIAEPITFLLLLAAIASTLVALGARESGDLFQRDWFWFTSGLALYFGSLAAIGPVSSLLQHSLRYFLLAYQARGCLQIVAMAAIAWGMVLPPAPARATSEA